MKKRFFNKDYNLKYKNASEQIKAINSLFLATAGVALLVGGLIFGIGKLISMIPPAPENTNEQKTIKDTFNKIETSEELLKSGEDKYRDKINSDNSNLKLLDTKDLTDITLKIFKNEKENETVMNFINKETKKDIIIAYKNLGTQSYVNPNLIQVVQISKTNYKIIDNITSVTWNININGTEFDAKYSRTSDINTCVSQTSNIDWTTVSKTIPNYDDISSNSSMHDYKDLIEASENKYRPIISDESSLKNKLSLILQKTVAGLNVNVFYNNDDKELVTYLKGSINGTDIDRVIAYKCKEKDKKCSFYYAQNILYIQNDNMNVFVSATLDKQKEQVTLSEAVLTSDSSLQKIKDY